MHQKIRIRDNLKQRFDCTRDKNTWVQYKKARNEVNNGIKQAKQNYFSMNTAIVQKYPRKTWRLINDLNSRKANEAPNFEGSALTNPADISEAFNSYFTTIGEKLANEIPSSTVDPIYYISPTNSVFTVEEIDVSTVDHLLRKINVNKATGLDGIRGKLLKMAASILSPSLTQIFNKSLFKGIYPRLENGELGFTYF